MFAARGLCWCLLLLLCVCPVCVLSSPPPCAGILFIYDTDTDGTESMISAITAHTGYTVTKKDKATWDGTNPAPAGFNGVVMLDATTYTTELSTTAQTALTNYVFNGGFYLGNSLQPYQVDILGRLQQMKDLVLLQSVTATMSGSTWSVIPAQSSHPVLSGIPSSFNVPSNGFDIATSVRTYSSQQATPVMTLTASGFGTSIAVAVRDYGTGRVVSSADAGNYGPLFGGQTQSTLKDANFQQLWANAITWGASAPGAANQCTHSSVVGDPIFAGFQGQNFQVHGIPDAWFNLLSSPSIHVNGRFAYLASGDCTYNDTECWTHAGTYIDDLTILFHATDNTTIRVRLVSGSHEQGLSLVQINDQDMPSNMIWSQHEFTVQRLANNRVKIQSPILVMMVVNSQSFFNLEMSLLDPTLLHSGRKHHIFSGRIPDKSNIYPAVPLHGIIGQTWRNAEYIAESGHHHMYEGDIPDYVCEEPWSTESVYAVFGK